LISAGTETKKQGRLSSVLFTGDHLAYSAANQALTGFRAYNHGSVEAQAESIQLLTSEDLHFDWILPGETRSAVMI
jgi:glyoxylase-like metal-dependent hydrolase (beta-lactamase superfamily II)